MSMEIRSLLRSLRFCYCTEMVKRYNMPTLTHDEHMAGSQLEISKSKIDHFQRH